MTLAPTIEMLEFEPDAQTVPLLEEVLAGIGVEAAVWHDIDSRKTYVRVYAGSPAEATAVNTLIQAALDNFPGMVGPELRRPTHRTLAREDWTETWKRYFHVFRASRRLVIKPSWEAYEAGPEDQVIELDPGMSFGTGYHGTTKACLQFMDDLQPSLPGASFLDAGCGSGILSIAAWKLGFRPVVAFDCDPQAVAVARENTTRTGADAKISQADLATLDLGGKFRLVAANILAPVLMRNAERLIGHLAAATEEASWLILAGILTDQYDEVHTRFKGLGLVEERRLTLDEWTSGLFRLGITHRPLAPK